MFLFGGAGANIITGGAGADEFQLTMSPTNDNVTDLNAAEVDTLTFLNTGAAEFDESSVSANSALNGITIEYSLNNQIQSLDISLNSEPRNLFVQRDIISSVEII